MSDTSWRLQAACRGMDIKIFFSDMPKLRREARETCESCPVLQACLAEVLHAEEGLGANLREGFYAGLTGRQRHAIAVPRKRRKKPKASGRKSARGEPYVCGTRRAYQRHVRVGEPIDDACRAANAAGKREWSATGSTELRPAG